MIFEPFKPFISSEFQIKYATEAWELSGAAALRRAVFCDEQGLFQRDDRDELDEVATTIVALSSFTIVAESVVGTVRIHEQAPGLWRGSRLAVAPDYRRVGAIGASLIRLAVSSAHALRLPALPRPCPEPERAPVPAAPLADAGGDRASRPTASSDGGRSRLLSAVPRARDRVPRAPS